MACPICKRETDPKYRPFCSRRCADIDLGRWLTGSYVIAGDADDSGTHPAPERPGEERTQGRRQGRD